MSKRQTKRRNHQYTVCLLGNVGHSATRRWGPHPKLESHHTKPFKGFSNRSGDLGLRRGGGCSVQDVGTWPVLNSHKHREEAARKYYAGMDVSLEETSICIVDEMGRIVKELRAASEPLALIEALGDTGLQIDHIGLEACSLAALLHDGLRSAGLPAICIDMRQANAAMKTMPNKTDRNDARALAQIMRTGRFRQVHVKSRQCRLWRSLLVARRTVMNEMRSIENVVRAILREGGIKLGTPARSGFAAKVREMSASDLW